MFRIIHKLFFLRVQQFSSSAANVKEPIIKPVNENSFSVRYLMDEFGFTLEKASSAYSQNVIFKNRDKPDAVVSFLKNHGFTHAQIQQLIANRLHILISRPEKTLLPKIEFFKSKGASSTDLARFMSFNPAILARSLKDSIVPSFKFFRDFLGSDQCVIHMLKRNAKVLTSIENSVKPIIETVRQAGVPWPNVLYLLENQPRLFLQDSDKLKESIKQVQEMGIDPLKCSYNLAITVRTTLPSSKWNEKLEAYKRWGCSEDEVLTAFKIAPWIMNLSMEKINGVMTFCLNEMGWQPSEVMRRYFVLTLSLNRRIIPRWSVYQELVSKKLVKGDYKKKLFTMKEDLFLEQYVNCYKNEAPLILKLYLDKSKASK